MNVDEIGYKFISSFKRDIVLLLDEGNGQYCVPFLLLFPFPASSRGLIVTSCIIVVSRRTRNIRHRKETTFVSSYKNDMHLTAHGSLKLPRETKNARISIIRPLISLTKKAGQLFPPSKTKEKDTPEESIRPIEQRRLKFRQKI